MDKKAKQLKDSHRQKTEAMRLEVMDLKKGFDLRCPEFKKQIEELEY